MSNEAPASIVGSSDSGTVTSIEVGPTCATKLCPGAVLGGMGTE